MLHSRTVSHFSSLKQYKSANNRAQPIIGRYQLRKLIISQVRLSADWPIIGRIRLSANNQCIFNIKFCTFVPSKSRSQSWSTIFAMALFDGEYQNLLTLWLWSIFFYPRIGTEIIFLHTFTWHGVFSMFGVWHGLFSLVRMFSRLRIEAPPLCIVQGVYIHNFLSRDPGNSISALMY